MKIITIVGSPRSLFITFSPVSQLLRAVLRNTLQAYRFQIQDEVYSDYYYETDNLLRQAMNGINSLLSIILLNGISQIYLILRKKMGFAEFNNLL